MNTEELKVQLSRNVICCTGEATCCTDE